MGLTRKEYVLQVTEQLVTETKTNLAGHGLNGAMLTTLAQRPDLLGKLAMFNYNSINAKKGAKGLKKSAGFRIFAYKTFGDFNNQARVDIENFMASLSPADAESFSNENNVLTLLALPDTATGDSATDISSMKSIALPFNSAVKKEYKLPGGFYVCVMFGDSYIAPKTVVLAASKEKVNEKIVERQNTPAKVKSKLQEKANAKLAKVKMLDKKLSAKRDKTAAELEQFAEIGKTFGLQNFDKPNEVFNVMNNYTKETKDFLRSLSAEDKKLYSDAVKYKKSGKLNLMYNLLAEVSPEKNEKVSDIVRNGNLIKADDLLAQRKKQLRAKIKEIMLKNEELLTKAENAPTAKLRANINFQIRKNIGIIKQLEAKINLHKDLSITTIKNKAKLLAQVNAELQANRNSGMDIRSSLESALNSINVPEETKQQIKQQVVQNIANQIPVDYAVQQAIQDTPMDTAETEIEDFQSLIADTNTDVFANLDDETAGIASDMANSKTIADILASL